MQRTYYLVFGYSGRSTNCSDLNKELALFFERNQLEVLISALPSQVDDIPLQIKRVGRGKRFILLANGVGTDLFMWLPIFESCLVLYPQLFEDYTFILPSYRGLFTNDGSAIEVQVTMSNCIADTLQIMRHFQIASYDAIIGWSTGAQLAITLCALHPTTAKKLFLLNPSTGYTLETVLQILIPLPRVLGKLLSRVIRSALQTLIPLCHTPLWVTLKSIARSRLFRVFLEGLAFFGGFPHYQPVFFHQYMFDVFSCPTHTMALLALIVALDEACPDAALALDKDTVLISGLMDCMTGVYHSWTLARRMPRCRHVCFSLGSHFALIEWPALIAAELAAFLQKPDTQLSDAPATKKKKKN